MSDKLRTIGMGIAVTQMAVGLVLMGIAGIGMIVVDKKMKAGLKNGSIVKINGVCYKTTVEKIKP